MSEERRVDDAWAIVLAHLWRGSAAVNRGFKLVSLYGVGGAAQTAIPGGENDVARILRVAWTVVASSGGTSAGPGSVAPGGGLNIYNVAGNTCALNVGGSGNATLQRTASTLTYDVTLLCLWQ